MMRVIAAAAACLACAVAVTAQQASASARPIDYVALRSIVGVSQPQLSPDGKRVAFIKSVSHFDTDKRSSQLMLLDVTTGKTRPLTYDRTGLDSPRWSPSGDRLAFIADAGQGDDAQAQIFVLPMNGGDALQATKAGKGVQEFAWRHDGGAFAFVTEDKAPNQKELDKHFDTFDVGDLDYKVDAAPVPSHVWIVSAQGGTAKRLTSGRWSISTVNGGGGAPISWSADGKWIAIQRLPNAVFGDSDASVVALVDAKSGAVHVLGGQRPYLNQPFFAPTGTFIAAAWYPHGTFNSNGYLTVTTASGGAGRVLGGQEHSVAWYQWTPDGRALAYAAEDGPRTGLWLQTLAGPGQRLDMGDVNFRDAFVGKNDAIVVVGDTPNEPGELYYFATPTSSMRRLTNFNASFEKLALGAETEVRWTGPGGYAEDGILTLPPGYVKGRRYPLALVVHGGPQSSSQLSFDDLTQLIAARGIVTFAPNYRGSTNLGDAYQHAIYRDTGDGPGKDVMAGVAMLEKAGYVDPSRMCVTGWSYGGYMTTWLESHYDVWKCAMAGAALTDWVADYTISFYQKGDADFFGQGSTPWVDKGWSIWREQSPIAAARNVKAPTLIMGDVGDPNVPIYNSYLWYHALRDNGVEVQFYAYPRNTHFPSDPIGGESVTRRWVDWVAQHLAR